VEGELEPHPWNGGFAWASTGDADFDELGYVLVPELFTAAEVATATAELDALEAEVDAFLQTQPDGRFSIAETGALTVTPHAVTRSEVLRDLSRHPRILDLCARFIGPDVRLYWDQAVYKKPEKPRRVPWHQDNGYVYVEPQAYLTVWVALTDATLENGCPTLAPGRHRLGTLAHRYVDPLGHECCTVVPDAISVEVPAGSAVAFSSLTPHLTGPNTSSGVRKAWILQYAPDGAEVLEGDPTAGPPARRVPCTHPKHQYEVLRGGSPV
jgi:ectoine hydroxylase-related dioxygenase (phytanoyl-CoA dioxygenase family)